MIPSRQRKGRLERHAVIFRRSMTTLIAIITAIFLLCVENVKSFTLPLSTSSVLLNENTLLLWKSTPAKNDIRATSDTINVQRREAGLAVGLRCNQRLSSTALSMMFGMNSSSSDYVLDMKTSIRAFGGWYNKIDAVARPTVYEDDMTDYTFSSPADSWPTSLENNYLKSSQSNGNMSRTSSETSNCNTICRIRKIASWVCGLKPMQRFSRCWESINYLEWFVEKIS